MYELYENEQYPMLAGLAYLRRWLDGFLSIVEGYLLTFSTVLITLGISMSMFDFLTNGAALNNPTVFTVWAGVQTVAIDAQFINMWFRLKVAIRERRFWLAAMYLLIGLILAFVTFGASVIPAIQKSTGVSFDSAISATGLNPLWMIYARYSVVILLGIIGAFSRSVIHFDETGKAKKATENASQVEENQPGFFTRKWAALRSHFALIRSVKLTPNTGQIDPNSETNTPEKVEEIIPELPPEQEAITDPVLPIVEAVAPPEPVQPCEVYAFTDMPLETLPTPFCEYEHREHGQASDIVTQAIQIVEELPPEPALHAVAEPQFKQPMNPQARYTAKEAVKWEICKKNGVKLSDISSAIQAGELKANLQGMFSKTALENWVKNRSKLAA